MQPTFSDFPPEVKLRIFSYLQPEDKLLRASLVCQEWRKLLLDFSLWRKIQLDGRKMTDEEAAEVVRRMPQPKKLFLMNFPRADRVLQEVTEEWSGLEGLDMKGVTTVTTYSMQAVAQQCVALREVSLDGCRHPEGTTNPIELFSACENLTMFKLVTFAKPAPISTTPKYPKLTQVNLFIHGGCDSELNALMDSSGGQLRQLQLRADLKEEPTLVALSQQPLEVLHVHFASRISDNLLRISVHPLHHLRELHLRNAGDKRNAPSGPALSALFGHKHFPNLEVLSLFSLPNLDDNHLFLMSNNCPTLVRLSLVLTQASVSGLVCVVRRCKGLKHLFFHPTSHLNLLKKEAQNLACMKKDMTLEYVDNLAGHTQHHLIPAPRVELPRRVFGQCTLL